MMKWLSGLLIVVLLIVGCLLLTRATAGVGILCIACIMGILARIEQADRHHQEVLQSNELMREEMNVVKRILAAANNVIDV